MNSFGNNEGYLHITDPPIDMFSSFINPEKISMPQPDQQSASSVKDTFDAVHLLLKWVRENHEQITQQLSKVEEKIEKISKQSDDLEKKIIEQSKRLETLETHSLQRSQAIIERQNECISLLESPELRQRYEVSDYGQDSDSLSDYSESGFSQDSEPGSDMFGHHGLNYD